MIIYAYVTLRLAPRHIDSFEHTRCVNTSGNDVTLTRAVLARERTDLSGFPPRATAVFSSVEVEPTRRADLEERVSYMKIY